MAQTDAVAELTQFARELHIKVRSDGEARLDLYLPGFASVTVEETESASLMAAIWVRSTSNDWPGERTDLNELFALLISLVLHSHGLSTQHTLVGHPAIDLPGEVYATYLFPRQPFPTGFPLTRAGIDEVRDLILDVSLTAGLVAFFLEVCGWDRKTEGCASQTLEPSEAKWVDVVEGLLQVDHDAVTFNMRRNPTWSFLRADQGISVFRSVELCKTLKGWFGHDCPARYEGPTGSVLKRDRLLNFVRRADLEAFNQMIVSLGEPIDGELVLAVENRVLAVAREHAILWAADASRSAAADERRQIAIRHASEHALLFDSATVRWSTRVDAQRFEQLVKLLLEHEPGVRHVRIAGATTEQDGGRDLLAEWDTPLVPAELDPDSPSTTYRTRRVVVQCKSDAAPVGIRRVSGVGDTLDQYQADGYLLVVRSRLTRPLVDRLDQRRAGGTAWVEWWGADELERRLVEHRHLAADYRDIVSID